jgi:homoserine kinase
VRIDVPSAWHCAVVHPDAVLETRRARAALAGDYALGTFVTQSANLALVLSGCHRGDADLVRAGLADLLVEPRRAPLIAGFAGVKQAALAHDAFGASISGAGPSVFAWFAERAQAEVGARAMQAAFADAGFASEAFVSPIDGPAAGVLA